MVALRKQTVRVSLRIDMRVRAILFCVMLIAATQSVNADGVQKFRRFGDVFMMLPLYVGVVTIGLNDYDGLAQLAIGTGATQLTIEAIKRGMELCDKLGYPVGFSFRPDGSGDPKGMPSGHSGGAWSGVAFVFYRYGPGASTIPVIVATAVSASRVVAKRHTVPQVVVGGLIAWGFGYMFTSKRHEIMVYPSIEDRGHVSMRISKKL